MTLLKRKKIAFITHGDASDRMSFSGTAFHTSFLLNRYCGEVHVIDKLLPAPAIPGCLFNHHYIRHSLNIILEFCIGKFWHLFGKNYDWRMTARASKLCAVQINEHLNQNDYDCVWVEKSSVSLGYLNTTLPVIYESDATFHAMIDYYPWFTGMTKRALHYGEKLEQTALRKAHAVIHTACWAKESAVRDYGIDGNKIFVLPSPPNLETVPAREFVLREKPFTVCSLLFIGTDWKRKGGSIAVSTVDELNKKGIPAQLIVCGCTPPEQFTCRTNLKIYGFIDQNRSSDRELWKSLFLESHFFFLPTRAECMGISFSEACAFGLPLVATNTGGVGTVVKNGVTGILLEYNEPPDQIAEKIANMWNNRAIYQKMRIESRRFYDETINGETWAASVNLIIDAVTAANTIQNESLEEVAAEFLISNPLQEEMVS